MQSCSWAPNWILQNIERLLFLCGLLKPGLEISAWCTSRKITFFLLLFLLLISTIWQFYLRKCYFMFENSLKLLKLGTAGYNPVSSKGSQLQDYKNWRVDIKAQYSIVNECFTIQYPVLVQSKDLQAHRHEKCPTFYPSRIVHFQILLKSVWIMSILKLRQNSVI